MNEKTGEEKPDERERIFRMKLLAGLLVLAGLTPLGIMLPQTMRQREAWGEWGPEYLRTVLGYLPEGLKTTTGLWNAPASNYTLPVGSVSLASQLLSYGISGMAGLLIVLLAVRLLMRVIKSHE